ncbi:MAG: hypothetical protein ACI83D_000381 [Planctomycetota bacterium]|jgi:uncharacterized protein (TIGR00725 family)
MNSSSHINIAVTGLAHSIGKNLHTLEIAEKLGQTIALHGHTLMTGSTIGFSLWSAKGAQSHNGRVVTFSPGKNKYEHEHVFQLPLQYADTYIFTGMGKAGKNILMTRSADVVIFGPGSIDVVQEFTIALQEEKPIGILEGPWQTDPCFSEILQSSSYSQKDVIHDADPRRLLEQLIAKIL